MSFSINFPSYGTITVSLPLVANLRTYPATDLLDGLHAIVSGQTTPEDGLGGIFTFDSASTTADNGVDVIAVNGVAQGRWIKTVRSIQGPQGIQGPVGPMGDVTPAATQAKVDAQAAASAAASSAATAASAVNGAAEAAAASATATATAAAASATASANNLSQAATATAGDRVATGADRIATSADRVSVAANRAAVDATKVTIDSEAATIHADRLDADQARDRAIAAAASVDTSAIADAKSSTAADRIAVHADKLASDTNAATSQSAANTAVAAANATGFTKFYPTKAAANADFAATANLAVVEVYPDESRQGRVIRYRKDTSVSTTDWVFVREMPRRLDYYVHEWLGNDANDGLTPHTPVKTLARLRAVHGPTDLFNSSAAIGCTIYIGGGSHFYGEDLINMPPFTTIKPYGQGGKPIIDNAMALFTGAWTYNSTYDSWFQDIVLPNALQGSFPGAFMWHVGLWADTIASQVTDPGLPRILNGDPIPDASYSTNWPQTTFIAQTSQGGLLGVLRDSTRGGFTLFENGGTSDYEPRNATGKTNFRVYIRNPDGSDPNAAGHPTYRINDMHAFAIFSQGVTVHDIIFARTGNKDAISPDYNNVEGALLQQIGTEAYIGVEFLAIGCHGGSAGGGDYIGCKFRGAYTNGSLKYSGGAFHEFRSQNSLVGTSMGFRVIDCDVEGAGAAIASHGNDGSNIYAHDHAEVRNLRVNNCGGVFDPGYNHKTLVASEIFATNIDQIGYTTGRISRSKFFGRKGATLSFGVVGKGTSARFDDVLIAGTAILLPYSGDNNTIPAEMFPTIEFNRSSVVGTLINGGSGALYQHNLRLRSSYVGTFLNMFGDDIQVLGFIDADASSILECATMSIERVREKYAGVAFGVETGVRRQVWSKALSAADLKFGTDTYFTASYSGGGSGTTANLTTSSNYNSSVVGRCIKIAGADSAGGDLIATVISYVDSNNIIVSPRPATAFSNKNVFTFYRSDPTVGLLPQMRDPVPAYISSDGTQLNVPDGTKFTTGMTIRLGQVRASAPSFGPIKITAVAGNIITISPPAVWNTLTGARSYAPVTNPTNAYGTQSALPKVTVSWGFSLIPPTNIAPTFTVAKVEGGSTTLVGVNQTNQALDCEVGSISAITAAGVGDVLTFFGDIDVPEFRLQLASPLMGGAFLPKPDCLVGQRLLGPTT